MPNWGSNSLNEGINGGSEELFEGFRYPALRRRLKADAVNEAVGDAVNVALEVRYSRL